MSKLLSREQIAGMFAVFASNNQEPDTELVYASNFELLVAVMLSAQSTDKSVNKATATLFPVANTPEAMLELGEDKLKQYIKNIGLYNNKAANIIASCQMLLDRYQGCIPDKREELEALPGVGRKTANVVLNTAFGQETMAVDTHIFRVSNRTGLAPAKTVLAVEKSLLKRIPKARLLHAHHWLILHGRYICTARAPKCRECQISPYCHYQNKNL